jgi:hypothetical protein
MPLNRGLRAGLYAALAVLFATGVAWLLIDKTPDPFHPESGGQAGPLWLAIHGAAAMLFLILFGALIPLHMQGNWSRDRNRWTGVVMLLVNGALIVTAYGLYYSGSDLLRGWAHDVHVAAGLFLPIWIAVHVWLGRRAHFSA